MSVEAAPVCYRHTDRETYIRCQRCERPICPDCMKSAAVGFQCPECVREGQRSGRQGRPLTLAPGAPVVTYALICINLLVWAAVMATPWLVYALSQHAENFCTFGSTTYIGTLQDQCQASGGRYILGTDHGGWWELITSIFTHQQIWHIGSNLLSLWMIGPLVEYAMGRARYLVAYLVCGLAGSFLVLATGIHDQYSLGASGAIFGLMGILLVLFLRRGLPLQQLGTVLVLNFVVTFTVPDISWQAHVGGFIAGVLIGAAMAYTPLGRRV